MKKMSKLMAFVLALVMVLGLAACGGNDGGGSNAGTDANNNTTGGDSSSATGGETGGSSVPQELNVSIAVDLQDFNPLTESTTEGAEMLMTMMDTLVRLDANGDVKPGSGLAESWDVSDDMLTYTFHLRDAQFSTGDPIRAQDFEYTWKKVLAPETASEYAYMLYPIAGAEAYNAGEGAADDVAVKALDDKTLEVTLVNPADYFVSMLVITQFSVVPEGSVEEWGDDFWMKPECMAASGPFMLTEWVADQYIVVEKNPNYWDADAVKLDKITFYMTMETNTIVNMYETDQVDVMLVRADFLDTYRNAAGFVSVVEPVAEYLHFNQDNPYFANLKIRQAFSMALNRDEYMNVYMRTGSTPATGFVPDGMPGSNGGDFRANVGDLLPDRGTGVTDEEVVALFEEGLAEVNGTREDLSSQVSLVIGQGDDNAKTAAVFQEYWKNVLGVDVEIKSLAYDMRQDEYKSRRYTIGKEGWGADFNDAVSFLELFITGSSYNNPNWSNAEYDNLIAQSRELTGDERLKALEKAETILLENYTIAPTFFQMRSWVCKDNVHGIVRNGSGLRCDYKWAYIG